MRPRRENMPPGLAFLFWPLFAFQFWWFYIIQNVTHGLKLTYQGFFYCSTDGVILLLYLLFTSIKVFIRCHRLFTMCFRVHNDAPPVLSRMCWGCIYIHYTRGVAHRWAHLVSPEALIYGCLLFHRGLLCTSACVYTCALWNCDWTNTQTVLL
jgi:hypothetical protein